MNELRQYIDLVSTTTQSIDEGVIDSIRKWVAGLASPIRYRGNQLSKTLEQMLVRKYGSSVPQQVQKTNKSWPWGKLTYADLYKFAVSNDFTDDDLDRALKNPIVTNNLKQLIRSLPSDVDAPVLPLKSANIKSNTNIISSTIDKASQQFLSKAIALAVIDGLAYIAQDRADKAADEKKSAEPAKDQADTRAAVPEPETAGSTPTPNPASGTEDIAATINAIKQGLARMKGAGE
jgi:hypothetical protein